MGVWDKFALGLAFLGPRRHRSKAFELSQDPVQVAAANFLEPGFGDSPGEEQHEL